MTTSLNGWQVPPKKLKTFAIPGADRRVTLDVDAGRILVALAADYHKNIRPIDKGTWDEGGFINREARLAAGAKSNHASGTAIDLNWSEEGAMGSAWGKKFFSNIEVRRKILVLKRRYGSVLQWGGDWRANDYMHWEIKPGISRTQVLALAEKLNINKIGNRLAAVPKRRIVAKPPTSA